MNSSSTERREIRRFGLIAFLFFGALSALGFWREKVVITYLFGAISCLGLSLLLFPHHLRAIYNGWVIVSHVIGRIVNITVLTLAYYLVITPSALIKRVFGGRPLPLAPDKNTGSYWVTRSEPAQPVERFIKRY